MKKIINMLLVVSCVIYIAGCNSQNQLSSITEDQSQEVIPQTQTEEEHTPEEQQPGEWISSDVMSTVYPIVAPNSMFTPEAMGYINSAGDVVAQPQFWFAYESSDGVALTFQQDSGYSYLSVIDGAPIIQQHFSIALPFSQGRALAWEDMGAQQLRLHILDTKGQSVTTFDDVPYQYRFYNNDLLTLEVQDGCRVINLAGEIVFESSEYSQISDYSEGMAAVQLANGNLGYIDVNGGLLLETAYPYGFAFEIDKHNTFCDGLALVQRDNLYGYIDKNGNEVITCAYLNAFPFSEGLARVSTDESGKVGFINTQGELEIPAEFDFANSFSEGVAAVYQYTDESAAQNRVGFINTAGELIIPFLYSDYYTAEEAYSASNRSSNGLIQVCSFDDGWFGYIDAGGAVVFNTDN